MLACILPPDSIVKKHIQVKENIVKKTVEEYN